MTFSGETRSKNVKRLQNENIDLLVLGGGITGAGVAVQATAAGIKTGLIEMQDFAEGTSSRSTKLVHGGLRYLKTFDVEVVSDTVKERAVVQGIAPHIPRPFPMLLPIYDDSSSTFNMFSLKVAMDLYDRLAGVEGTKYANYTIDKDEVIQREPGIKQDKLLGAGVYLDYVNNDSRLVIENIKEAHALGGIMVSRVKAVAPEYDVDGTINGVKARDELTGEEFIIHAKLVINTTGPWVDKIFAHNEDKSNIPRMRPTKGIHLVVDEERLVVPQPTYFDSGMGDGRMIFVVPREGKTYFGTTDTDYHGNYRHPRVEQEDVTYLLKAINKHFPNAALTLTDIEASWAGLRPLIAGNSSSDYNGGGANTGKVSEESFAHLLKTVASFNRNEAARADVEQAISQLKTARVETELSASQVSRGSSLDVGENRLITLSGGKITDYRKMAAGALRVIKKMLQDYYGIASSEIDSKKLQVSGGHFDPTNVEDTMAFYKTITEEKGIPEKRALELANRYGSNTPRVISNINKVRTDKESKLDLAERLSIYYAVTEEMTLTPVDYLLRRTNHMLFHADQLEAIKEAIIEEMAVILRWSSTEKSKMQQQLEQTLAETRLDYLKKSKQKQLIG
ncbi:type 1 glycerol-3-phosphate oxidase [Liquorilactobacillus capillatus]|uniref:Alpha-glycerophosphate oxidase n=1 Tax=Liquorilactobacillus capillatus DSM 19910 TaxID=1423731 RepID=A0A0R1M645_9LACO|nr:type 1 glycerol-3-phosphate oxidase [Liquorilactobacillus capillatus]KRL00482.1 alpha-glycerophosphate oxidase [Liquorilactobacillus capillatus DSM 19910]